MSRFLPILFLVAALSIGAADFPEAQISNGAITARFYLPDAERGYYRGTRFDWSGVIYSLQAGGHEYFGQWFDKYDPKLHDAITGPVEEFRTGDAGLGFEDAKPGDTFIRIGVGVVRRPDDRPYQMVRTYEIVDPGKWAVKTGRDRIEFTHDLTDKKGYSYKYTKVVRLEGNKPEMVIEHSLKNTGTKAISTSQYNHNFFVIDGQPSGPDTSVRVPFELKPVRPFRDNNAVTRGGEIVYQKELEKGQSVFGEFAGFGKDASDYDIHVENKKAGAGVRIRGDRPLSKLVYWSIRTTACPEPYIDMQVEPGREFKWTYRYEFYNLPR